MTESEYLIQLPPIAPGMLHGPYKADEVKGEVPVAHVILKWGVRAFDEPSRR